MTPHISREDFRKGRVVLGNGCRAGRIVSCDIPLLSADTDSYTVKHICKYLISYIAEECGQKVPKGSAMGDLKLIAMDSVAAETLKAGLVDKSTIELGSFADYTTQLLKLVLWASINSPRSTEYIARMPTFSTATQASLKSIIEEVMKDDGWRIPRPANHRQIQGFGNDETGNNSGRGPVNASVPVNDPELLFEERIGRVMAENENLIREKKELQKDLRELHNRLIRLQENNVGGPLLYVHLE